MHTASYEFLMKPKDSAGCHQTLSVRVGSGDETTSNHALLARYQSGIVVRASDKSLCQLNCN